jgi:hypothetical protein
MLKQAFVPSFVELGFEPITEWVIRKDKIKLQNLQWQDHAGWLYAFVVNDQVKYVGLTTRILRSRMDDYSYIREEQCAHKRTLILAEINAGNRVQVFGRRFADEQELIAAESSLRQTFDLEWNRI